MFDTNVNGQLPAPVFEVLGKFGSILGICPQFDFRSETLIETKLFTLKSFIISIWIIIINIINIIDTGIWGGQYYLNSIIVFSITSTVIMTCEAILSPLIRKGIWLRFFRKYSVVHQTSGYKRSKITDHFYRNIKKYYVSYLTVNVTIMSLGYVLWLINQYDSKDSYERSAILNFLLGDSTTMFFYNAEKFLIASLLYDIKNRYNWLSWKVTELTPKYSRRDILKNVETIELQTLQMYDVVYLFKQLFETHFFLMMVFGFSFGLEYCIFNYSMFEVETTNVYLIILVSILSYIVNYFMIKIVEYCITPKQMQKASN